MTEDPYHDRERFSVVREGEKYAVIDKQNKNTRYSRHSSSTAAHAQADTLNAQHRAEEEA